MMRLLAVAEGGAGPGLGHIRRCLALAAALEQQSVRTAFAVIGGAEVRDFVAAAGFEAVAIGGPADAVRLARRHGAALFDTYRVTTDVLRACSPAFVAVIDDLADRDLPAAIVINSAPGAAQLPYDRLTDATLLLGPAYALLRPEFGEPFERRIAPQVSRILVTLGGSSQGAAPGDVAACCAEFAEVVEVVVGPFQSSIDCSGRRIAVLRNPDMRVAMLRADLAVSGGGQTLFELAATGLPAVALQIAENQRNLLADFERLGTIVRTRGGIDVLRAAVESLMPPDRRRAMSDRGPAIVDGRGAIRTAETIVKLLEARSAKS